MPVLTDLFDLYWVVRMIVGPFFWVAFVFYLGYVTRLFWKWIDEDERREKREIDRNLRQWLR